MARSQLCNTATSLSLSPLFLSLPPSPLSHLPSFCSLFLPLALTVFYPPFASSLPSYLLHSLSPKLQCELVIHFPIVDSRMKNTAHLFIVYCNILYPDTMIGHFFLKSSSTLTFLVHPMNKRESHIDIARGRCYYLPLISPISFSELTDAF